MSLWLAILLGVCFLFALLEYHMAASSSQGMLIRGGRNQKRKARELDNIIAEPIDNEKFAKQRVVQRASAEMVLG